LLKLSPRKLKETKTITWKKKNSKKKSIPSQFSSKQESSVAPVQPMMKHRFIRKATDTPMLSHRPNVAEQKESSLEFVLHRFNQRFKEHASVYSLYHLLETLFLENKSISSAPV